MDRKDTTEEKQRQLSESLEGEVISSRRGGGGFEGERLTQKVVGLQGLKRE